MNFLNIFYSFLLITGMGLFTSCAVIPEKAKPVDGFDINLYMGSWYEVARLDHRFERDLDNVTAYYSLKDNGLVKVENRGYDRISKKWKSVSGLAKFRNQNNIGALKVSFFRPFYGSYNVIALDKDYQYALVAGNNLNYLWILARTKNIPIDIRNTYLEIAKDIGYDTTNLIWVKQDMVNPSVNGQ